MNITIADALLQGLNTARQCTDHRRNQEKAVAYLSDFFNTAGVIYWKDVTIDHIRQFVTKCESRNLAPGTIRAYTNPLRLAHRATRKEISTGYLKLTDLIPARQMPSKAYLSAKMLTRALELADKKKDHCGYFVLAMGAMVGLRITEAMRLEPQDYDPIEKTLLIGAEHKEKKNQYSGRIIPVCDCACAIIEWHFKTRRKSYTADTSASHSIRRILDLAAEHEQDEGFRMVKPRDAGRKTFLNLLETLDVDSRYSRAYAGHAPERWDTMSKHYLALVARPDSMPHVKLEAIEKMRRKVIEPLNNFF